ncbi:MAG: hypothetical protein JWR19_2850 [Pedosphaera sp.]|nr:hypothetical protein [Pedosphaera sp.]
MGKDPMAYFYRSCLITSMVTLSAEFPIRLVQHKATRLYYQSPGRWTSSLTEAIHFQDMLSAAHLCRQQHLDQVELVLNFGQPKYDIRLSLNP